MLAGRIKLKTNFKFRSIVRGGAGVSRRHGDSGAPKLSREGRQSFFWLPENQSIGNQKLSEYPLANPVPHDNHFLDVRNMVGVAYAHQT